MKLLVALGNIGIKYEKTRHNAGFMFADFLANKYGFDFKLEPKFKTYIAKTVINNKQIIVIKPTTFMNLSAQAILPVMNFYKIGVEDLFVVFDDISLDLGVIRYRAKGSDGGHNGVKSIIAMLGHNEFDRLKIGIGPQYGFMKSEDFVLQNFDPEQLKQLEEIFEQCEDMIFKHM